MSATNKRTGSIQLQDFSPLIRRIEWFSEGLLAFSSRRHAVDAGQKRSW